MAEPITQSFSTTLMDAHSDHDGTQPIRLAGSPHGVSLFALGYGDHGSAEGHGSPVFLELYGGQLWLVVWADINSEKPTHIIPLGGAREANRRPEDPE
jgi:hypothetical protein